MSKPAYSYDELSNQLRFTEQSHDWLYGEKQRLEGALRAIVASGPSSTVDDLVLIALSHLPRAAAPDDEAADNSVEDS